MKRTVCTPIKSQGMSSFSQGQENQEIARNHLRYYTTTANPQFGTVILLQVPSPDIA